MKLRLSLNVLGGRSPTHIWQTYSLTISSVCLVHRCRLASELLLEEYLPLKTPTRFLTKSLTCHFHVVLHARPRDIMNYQEPDRRLSSLYQYACSTTMAMSADRG